MDARCFYSESRAEFLASFAEYELNSEAPNIFRSPSGEFELEVSRYTFGDSGWGYSRGIARRTAAPREVVADIKRNYPGFWHGWVNHSNGNEYLLCGEDYQCYNVIELASGRQSITVPLEIVGGGGFCWTGVVPSPTTNLIAVEGCIWAGPGEVVILDFREPLRSPLPEVLRVDDRDGDGYFVEFVRWSSERTIECLVETESGESVKKTFEVGLTG